LFLYFTCGLSGQRTHRRVWGGLTCANSRLPAGGSGNPVDSVMKRVYLVSNRVTATDFF
jgi:hypothetical protein